MAARKGWRWHRPAQFLVNKHECTSVSTCSVHVGVAADNCITQAAEVLVVNVGTVPFMNVIMLFTRWEVEWNLVELMGGFGSLL